MPPPLHPHSFPTRRSSDLILAAIAIPNLLTAMQRSKQKRTMADLRTIATAWEARATDLNKYNAAGAISIPGNSAGLTNLADRKSTRLNSSHLGISYAVFCL